MVSGLLVGDRRFIENGDGPVYTEGAKGAETGGRYLEWFDSLTVVGRIGDNAELQPDRLNQIDSANWSFVAVPNLSGIGARLRNVRHVRAVLSKLIDAHDALIARMPTQLGLEAISLALAAGRPVAIDLGGCPLDGLRAYGTLKAWLYAPIASRLVRRAVSRVQWVSYVTQEYLQQRYPAAPGAVTIGCSNVDLPSPDERPLENRLGRLARQDGLLTFGTVGSLYGSFKGVHHALAALEQAAPRLPPFQYRVLGGGDPAPWRDLAQRHGLGDRVVFDGTLPAGAPVLKWLDQVDIYLQPSLREGVPRALIEAMSRGCPAIASDIAGIPELLPPEVLHQAGDVERLRLLVEEMSNSAVMSQRAQENWERARAYSRENLGPVRDEFWSAFAKEALRRRAVRKPAGSRGA